MRPILRHSLFAGRHLSYEQHIRLGCDQGAQPFSNHRMILDAQNTNRLVRLHRSVSQGTGARWNAATFDASRHVPFILRPAAVQAVGESREACQSRGYMRTEGRDTLNSIVPGLYFSRGGEMHNVAVRRLRLGGPKLLMFASRKI